MHGLFPRGDHFHLTLGELANPSSLRHAAVLQPTNCVGTFTRGGTGKVEVASTFRTCSKLLNLLGSDRTHPPLHSTGLLVPAHQEQDPPLGH